MTASTDIILENNTSSKQFLFRAVAPLRVRKSQPAIAIPLVNTSPDNTFLFRFSGQEEEVSFTFALFDDGVDVSNGTGGSVINTLAEQISYLKDTIYSDNFDDDWTIWDTYDRFYPSPGVNVVITDLSIDNAAGQTTIATGSITFKRGRIGSL
jgi:hypothetical protein